MSDARAEIVRRIRGALAQPLGEGTPAVLPTTDASTYLPLAAGETLADRFTRALVAVSGRVVRLDRRDALLPHLRAFVVERGFRRAAVVRSGVLSGVEVESSLREINVETRSDGNWLETPDRGTARLWLSEADLCISGVDFALAETGSVLVQARPGQPRAATLLPPVHVAVIGEEQLVPAFETVVPMLKASWTGDEASLVRSLTLITGPSRSADIEQTLTLGVHGPIEVIAILLPAS